MQHQMQGVSTVKATSTAEAMLIISAHSTHTTNTNVYMSTHVHDEVKGVQNVPLQDLSYRTIVSEH